MGEEKILTGAEIIIECLKEQQVDTVFGYPGGTVISVYDALFKNKKSIRHILTSHEQGAAHAADGYARATGKTGVCLVTSGPGATNIVTGIATAYMDSIPLVALTINVPVDHLGKDSFQEVDIAGITMPITKYNYIVKDISRLADTLRRAFSIAQTGRKGPVLIDITRDVTEASTIFAGKGKSEDYAEDFKAVNEVRGDDTKRAELKKELTAAAKLMKKAKRPVLLVGGGCVHSKAQKELVKLVDKFRMPVIDTLMGKGAFPGTREEYLGMTGRHGTKAANNAVANADLLLAVGTRFSDRVADKMQECVKNAHIIQIDIDKAELNKNFTVDVGINADAAEAVGILADLLPEKSFGEWLEHNCSLKEESLKKNSSGAVVEKTTAEKTTAEENTSYDQEDSLNGEAIVRHIYRLTGGNAIITTEVGQNQMLAAAYYSYSREGQLITSGGLGTMGFGLGAAIGAGLGCPDKKIVNIAGDGCFRMNMNELMTAVRYGVPLVEVIIDNNALGMVHQMQREMYDGRFSETEFFDSPDFVSIAKAMGAKGAEPSNLKEFDRVFAEALKEETVPSVIVCHVSINEIV